MSKKTESASERTAPHPAAPDGDGAAREPRPSHGGSYVRQPDGALERAGGTEAAPANAARKKGRK